MCYAIEVAPIQQQGSHPVHGYPMRSPLEAIKEGWMEGELSRVNAVDWVANLRESFTRLYSQASRREGEYKERTKLKYDEKTKP